MRSVLVTGGAGFLGQASARVFRGAGWRVAGLGRRAWGEDEARAAGFHEWHDAAVTLPALRAAGRDFDAVVHCAGNGSVAFSSSDPLAAWEMTVDSTAQVLEFVRTASPRAIVLYPSSAAVYGAAGDEPLREDRAPNPISPYGDHKIIVERLLQSHAAHFGIRSGVVRYFSIYGPGLAKQLLFDATRRFECGGREVVFHGTGGETRDWIHVDDAAALMLALADSTAPYTVVNGASGERTTVRDVLERLRAAVGSDARIAFNGMQRPGDPRHYHADMRAARALGFENRVPLDQGLRAYVDWYRSRCAA